MDSRQPLIFKYILDLKDGEQTRLAVGKKKKRAKNSRPAYDSTEEEGDLIEGVYSVRGHLRHGLQ